jgi:hypothetical protein
MHLRLLTSKSREDQVAVPNTCQRILPRAGARGRGMRAGMARGARAAVVLSPMRLAHRVIMSRRPGRAAEDGLCTIADSALENRQMQASRAALISAIPARSPSITAACSSPHLDGRSRARNICSARSRRHTSRLEPASIAPDLRACLPWGTDRGRARVDSPAGPVVG